MPTPFVHLHTHSHYSLLDGLSKVEDLVARAKELGMTALALTDHGAMYGAIDFYKACKDAGIKPIVGVEAYVAARTRFDKDSSLDSKRFHLTLLARNTAGYKNLMKMVSKSYLEGFYYKPRMDKDLLRQHADGLICLSGCPGSEFIWYVKNGQLREAKELLQFYIEIFGKEHVFVEIMKHDEIDWYQPIIPTIVGIAKDMDLPIVATWDSHYLHADDKEAHNTLLAINTNNANFKMDGNYSLIDGDTAAQIYADIPGAVENTNKVADLVDIEIDTKSWYFPHFPIPEGQTHDQILREMTYAGLEKRGMEKTPEVLERIEYELKTISDKGYPSYFLCVSDFLSNATRLGIYSQTRGSAAGSLVSYLIGISNIDPMKYGLLFERFLNPDRPSLPDIDMDFADNRRDDIIAYARQKYGQDAVAQIGTFGTMMARGAVRDVARAMGYPYGAGDRISKLIPMGSQGFAMTLKRAMDMEPELKNLYETDREVRAIVDMAKKLEGNVRHLSTHAAGVVISPTGHVDDFSPVQLDPKDENRVITQYDMYTGGGEGIINLPKFDFLGLRNLTILKEAVDRIKTIRNIDIDIEAIPLDDHATFELFGRGETVGVFQFASAGMKKWLREMKPSVFEDLIAMVALYRPGPMAFIPDYIERKHGKQKVTYIHPKMAEILSSTYGIIIYQEDTMRMATDIAGYTRGESDKFRKAIGKKIPEEMAKQHDHFVDGCVETSGFTKAQAEELWSTIETFAAYGFNKSHAAVYALLAYRTAYLKAHYAPEYMTAIMTAESDNLETVAETIAEARMMGFTILPPDINESFSDFTVVVEDGQVTNKIRFGLRSIKNFGEEIGKAIIAERKANGRFKSLEDFLERVQHRNMTKKSLEALIMCGALDAYGERGMLMANLETMLTFNKELAKFAGGPQDSLFADFGDAMPAAKLNLAPAEPASDNQRLGWEKELLGLFVSGHPLDRFRSHLEKAPFTIKDITNEKQAGKKIQLLGIIEDVRELYTKKQDKMAFVRLADFSGTIDTVLFPETFLANRQFIGIDRCVVVEGTITSRNGELSIIVNSVRPCKEN